MLSPNEQRVLDAATELATALGHTPIYTVAAAAMDTTGRIHTGVNVAHFTGGPCAEMVAIGAAGAVSAGPLTTMVAVGAWARAVMPPCGRCRQVLLDLHPDCFVIVPTPDGPERRPIRELLPFAYSDPEVPPERFVRFDGRYHDAIAAGLKTATIRYRDPVAVGPALFVFEEDDGYRQLHGQIDQVESRSFDALTEDDVRLENVSSVDALRDGLRGHYPGITNDAVVDVVRFHVDEAARSGRCMHPDREAATPCEEG